jgi:catechol 2,3-dioxygenase-like lactoylglutathione lyase family enzyme
MRMLKTEGVLHFTIPVKNLDRSEKFYTEILGFKKIGRTERIVFLRAGDNYFNLTYSENPIHPNVGDKHEIHSAFRMTPQAYDEALRMLPAKGIEIFKQEERSAGVFVGRSAYIHDPDRNVIEFIDLARAPVDQA